MGSKAFQSDGLATSRRPIFVNMRFLTQPLSGMQRYAEELVAALDVRLAEDPEYLGGAPLVGLVPKGALRQRDWKAIEIRHVGRLSGHAWEQLDLAGPTKGGTLVSLAGSGPLAHSRHVLAIHDANLFVNPHFFSRRYRMLHGFLRPRLARRAKALITISEFSRRELTRCFALPEDRFVIVADSAEHILNVKADQGILTRHGLVPGRYALCVGNQGPNKNIGLAVAAFKALAPQDMKLAVAGGSSAALARADAMEAPWLAALGRITDGELRALYENAAMFIFPSIYEGFGVPPLEAMALGCPVVSSDSSAMSEVLGDAALFFPSGDAEACAARIREVMELDEAARQSLMAAGREQAARYRWQRSADRLAELLRELEGV